MKVLLVVLLQMQVGDAVPVAESGFDVPRRPTLLCLLVTPLTAAIIVVEHESLTFFGMAMI